MQRAMLQNLVKAYYNEFATAYGFKDFPLLADVFAIVTIESSWDPEARSPVGAIGLMQITKPALEQINTIYSTNFTMDDMTRPDRNIWVGIRYLRWLYRTLSLFVNARILAVLAYNWGIGNVLDWIAGKKSFSDIPKESKDYVLKYLYWREYWEKQLKKERKEKGGTT